jgi:hypothetical protein
MSFAVLFVFTGFVMVIINGCSAATSEQPQEERLTRNLVARSKSPYESHREVDWTSKSFREFNSVCEYKAKTEKGPRFSSN